MCDSVVARLRLRMAAVKCIPLVNDTDRNLVDAAVQGAQQQGATVSRYSFRMSVVLLQ